MKQTLSPKRRVKGTGHTTIPRVTSHTLFTFDDTNRHRNGLINGEMWIANSLLAELGEPQSIEIDFGKGE